MMDSTLTFDNDGVSDAGFVYVASNDRLYYELALISCQTLKDYWPNSSVTLFTHEKFIDDRVRIFDKVYTNIPIHKRTKMWCMARTPYDRTIYNDCDSIIRHRDVKKMHSFLNECDMYFIKNIDYTVANIKWAYIDKAQTIEPPYHGALCGYHKTDLNLDFMQTWFDEYVKQTTTPWPYGKDHYREWQQFDMFTLWRMTSGKFSEFDRFNDLNIIRIPRRFNSCLQDLPQDLEGPPVITQIDRDSWTRMPTVWNKIKETLYDGRYTLEQSKINKATLEYN